jgi:hypothetical protein
VTNTTALRKLKLLENANAVGLNLACGWRSTCLNGVNSQTAPTEADALNYNQIYIWTASRSIPSSSTTATTSAPSHSTTPARARLGHCNRFSVKWGARPGAMHCHRPDFAPSVSPGHDPGGSRPVLQSLSVARGPHLPSLCHARIQSLGLHGCRFRFRNW